MALSDFAKAENIRALQVIREMDAQYGSEIGYQEEAMRDIKNYGKVICKKCDFENPIPFDGERKLSCSKCKFVIWITAETFYHKARKFRPRAIIMRFHETGIVITANQAAKLLQVSNDLVNLVYRQIGIVVCNELPADATEDLSKNCLAVVSRRSTETPAREPPRAEESEMATSTATPTNSDSQSADKISKLRDTEKLVFESLLAKEQSFEQLLSSLSLDSSVLSRTLMKRQ